MRTILVIAALVLSGCEVAVDSQRNGGDVPVPVEPGSEAVDQEEPANKPVAEDPQTAAADSTPAFKLQSAECKDPSPEELKESVEMMACDGTTLVGELKIPDMTTLVAENIREGVVIAGVEGTFAGAPQAYVPQTGDIDTDSLVKISSAEPLLALVSDEDDCRSRMSDSQSVTSRGSKTATIDGKFYIFMTCKAKSFNSWRTSVAHWAPGTSLVWLDYDTDTAAYDPLWGRYSHHMNDSDLGHINSTMIAQKSDGTIHGILDVSGNGLAVTRYKFSAPNFAALSSASIDPAANNLEAPQNGVFMSYPYRNSYEMVEFKAKDYLFYEVSHYGAAIGAVEYTDLDSLQANADDALVEGVRHPFVAATSERVYLMGLDVERGVWKITAATSVEGLDWDKAVDANLRSLFGDSEAWDYQESGVTRRNQEPTVIGLESNGSELFIFYRAGHYQTWPTSFDSANPENIGERGIGVIKLGILADQ